MLEVSLHTLRVAKLMLEQLFTIGTAVCMIIGKK